ncbi:hypothetical protein [Halocynthiibacter styelae]|uniref:Uncharacterized protein n=1 Tax=Halocynthiibacter styelae TaxID=2761955 RepID=A0A8J7IY99_9RHOB|nr:hypothetical protein [Paenihalocynthiibacter styelae]MBI1495078.1 hypothetical protein [Paenihalocynthiibacter styelae]
MTSSQPNLFLHLGPPKSASTTIQAYLDSFRLPLLKMGLYVPRRGRTMHNAIIQTAIHPHYNIDHFDPLSAVYWPWARSAKAWANERAHCLQELAKPLWDRTDIILSSEALFFRDPHHMLGALKAFCDLYGYRLRPVLYLRNPVSAARSFAAHSMVWAPFVQNDEAHLQRIIHYCNHLEKFVMAADELLGSESCILRPLHRDLLPEGCLFTDLHQSLGLPAYGNWGKYARNENEGYGQVAAELSAALTQQQSTVHATPQARAIHRASALPDTLRSLIRDETPFALNSRLQQNITTATAAHCKAMCERTGFTQVYAPEAATEPSPRGLERKDFMRVKRRLTTVSTDHKNTRLHGQRGEAMRLSEDPGFHVFLKVQNATDEAALSPWLQKFRACNPGFVRQIFITDMRPGVVYEEDWVTEVEASGAVFIQQSRAETPTVADMLRELPDEPVVSLSLSIRPPSLKGSLIDINMNCAPHRHENQMSRWLDTSELSAFWGKLCEAFELSESRIRQQRYSEQDWRQFPQYGDDWLITPDPHRFADQYQKVCKGLQVAEKAPWCNLPLTDLIRITALPLTIGLCGGGPDLIAQDIFVSQAQP